MIWRSSAFIAGLNSAPSLNRESVGGMLRTIGAAAPFPLPVQALSITAERASDRRCHARLVV
jgi:hypothetical protein